MVDQGGLTRDTAMALDDVGRLREALLAFPELDAVTRVLQDRDEDMNADLERFHARVGELLERLGCRLGDIQSPDRVEDSSSLAFSLASLTNELYAQLEWLMAALEHVDHSVSAGENRVLAGSALKVHQPVRAALTGIKARLVPLLKRFVARIWQVISGLVTPYEWKLQGKLGTGVLGLGDVGLEVTFRS